MVRLHKMHPASGRPPTKIIRRAYRLQNDSTAQGARIAQQKRAAKKRQKQGKQLTKRANFDKSARRFTMFKPWQNWDFTRLCAFF